MARVELLGKFQTKWGEAWLEREKAEYLGHDVRCAYSYGHAIAEDWGMENADEATDEQIDSFLQSRIGQTMQVDGDYFDTWTEARATEGYEQHLQEIA